MKYAQVRLLDAPFSVDKPYTYAIPDTLPSLRKGMFVRVPFGRSDRVTTALVTSLSDTCDIKRVKLIICTVHEDFSLDDEMFDTALFLCEHTLCTMGDATRAILPPGALDSRAGIRYRRTVYPQLSSEQLISVCSGTVKLRSEAHRAILLHFSEHREQIPLSELCDLLGVTAAQVKAMADRGYLAYGSEEVMRNPYDRRGMRTDNSPIALSRAQNTAWESLAELYHEDSARAALLFGITGSGKTKVMMKMIDEVIGDGKQAIMLVPEIALTPQTVGIFCKRYGNRVAVVHSSLSVGERADAWRRARFGEVDLVIGTRSAVFSPLSRLGAVFIDEEHEHTYKSDSDPKYHARDVAAFRCGRAKALMILASATPSFESYTKAKEGKYLLVPLRERYGGAVLPKTEIIDMREELRRGGGSPYSARLKGLIEQAKSGGEQTILFINRRGYNTSLQCKNCGEVLTCPHCSVALTYHTSGGAHLMCHCCGFSMPVLQECPACHSKHLSYVGFGTQKAEAGLISEIPGVRVMRMDADTTSGKQSYDHMLESFRRGESDVLLGTQMVTKGHDFPSVTLVGVLLADLSLFVNDFRASERAFSQLTQVIGRAGRAQTPGVAVIQTYQPNNEVIRYACEQDYEGFYSSEIELRRSAVFPPFCDICLLTVTADSEKELFDAASELTGMIKELSETSFRDLPVVVFGPFEAHIYKAAEKYRLQMVIKCRLNRRTRAMLASLLMQAGSWKKVVLKVDFNPLNM